MSFLPPNEQHHSTEGTWEWPVRFFTNPTRKLRGSGYPLPPPRLLWFRSRDAMKMIPTQKLMAVPMNSLLAVLRAAVNYFNRCDGSPPLARWFGERCRLARWRLRLGTFWPKKITRTYDQTGGRRAGHAGGSSGRLRILLDFILVCERSTRLPIFVAANQS